MTPRESDRFEVKARELRLRCEHQQRAICLPCLVAALRQVETATLDVAARVATAGGCDCNFAPCEHDEAGKNIAHRIRALKPPAAAAFDSELMEIAAALRAAESSALERAAQLCDSRAANMDGKESLEIATLQLRGASEGIRALIPPAAAPAAETGKAQEAEARDLFAARLATHLVHTRARISELETALREARDQLCAEHCEWTGSGEHDDQCVKLSKALAARAAPPEGEGKQMHVAGARIAELEAALLDFLCSHGPPDCAGKGECVCDAAWPLFGLPHGRVDLARAKLAPRAAQTGGQ